MKGRNCYALFSGHPGLEKLLTIDQAKRSFLKPVTLSSVQRDLFNIRIATGSYPCVLDAGFLLEQLCLGPKPGRYFVLCRTSFNEWPVHFLLFESPTSPTNRPLFFCLFFYFRVVVGLLACLIDMAKQSCPATAHFSALVLLTRGRLCWFRAPPPSSSFAGHRLFQRLTFFTVWPVTAQRLLVVFNMPYRPF